MIISIFLLLFYMVFIVVSGNPISQLIPSQQFGYQQTAYRNQPSRIPILLQQPTNIVLPYNQPVMTQNQLAPSYQGNYEVFPISDDMNHVLFESFPNFQPILDPNYLTYGQNGVESQILNAHNYRTPNIVNNYIIVPPDCCKCNNTQTKVLNNHNKQINQRKMERQSRKKDGNQNLENKPKASKTLGLPTIPIDEHKSAKLEDNQGGTRKRKRNKKPKEDSTKENKHKDNNNKSIKAEDQEIKIQANKSADKQNNDISEVKSNQAKGNHSEKIQSNNQHKRKRKSKPKSNNGTALVEPASSTDNNQNKDNAHFTLPQAEQIIEFSNVHFENQNNVQPCQVRTDPLYNKAASNQARDKNYQKTEAKEKALDSVKIVHNNHENNQMSRNQKTNTMNDMNEFSSVPAEMQNIMAYMKSNFNGQPFGNSDIFANYPFNFDQLYQGPQSSDTTNDTNRKRRRKRPRRPQNKKRKGDQNKTAPNQTETNIESTTTVVETIRTSSEIPIISNKASNKENALELPSQSVPRKFTIESPEKSFEIQMEVPHKINSQSEEQKNGKNSEEHINYEIFSKLNDHGDEISDLIKDDKVPIVYDNELIYDYYPDFTDSAGLFANNREYYVKHPANHGFQIQNNRNIDINILNHERRKHDRQHKNIKPNLDHNHEIFRHVDPKENEPRDQNEFYEEVTTPQTIIEKTQSPKIEEILFKTPPSLEFPDFKTVKVNKEHIKTEIIEPYYNFNDNNEQEKNTEYLIDKSSIYSNVKTPMYNLRAKPSKITQKPQTTDIETVFVNSKVVKYGQIPKQLKVETTTSKITASDRIDDRIITDDGTTIVVAESLGYPEEIWYT